MSITQTCSPNAFGFYPEGAWVNVEPVHAEGQRVERAYEYTNGAGEVIKGITHDPVITTFKPQVSPDHVLHTAYIGRVLSTGEVNGYDDSDFYAIVWNDERQTAERIVYATTRAWTYDRSASVDATPEVLAIYEAKCAYGRRTNTVLRKRTISKKRSALAAKLGVRPSAIKRLEAAYGALQASDVHKPSRYDNGLGLALGFYHKGGDIDRVVALISSLADNKLRSAFKKKLAEQVVAWLRDPAPQYATPLSKKQLEYA